MAAVFTFDKNKAIKSVTYPKEAATIAQVEKALRSKKVPEVLIGLFVTQLKKTDFDNIWDAARTYYAQNVVGLPKKVKDMKNPSALEAARQAVVVGPQAMVLMAKFDLSVHLKDPHLLELRHTDCKGNTKTLFSVRPTPSIA